MNVSEVAASGESESLQQDPPSETYTFTFAEGFGRWIWSAPVETTAFAGGLTAFFLLFVLCMMAGGGLPVGQMGKVPLRILGFFGFVWCFCSIAVLPLTLIHCLFDRTRIISVKEGQVQGRIGRHSETIDLKTCTWSTSRFSWDCRGIYYCDSGPRLSVHEGGRSIGLGYTEEAAERWIQFLKESGVPRRSRARWPRNLTLVVLSLVFGATIGLLCERLLPVIGAQPIQNGALVFIGALDGGLLGACVLATRCSTRVGERPVGIALLSLVFAGLAARWGGDTWLVIGMNAAVGALGGWLLLPKNQESMPA